MDEEERFPACVVSILRFLVLQECGVLRLVCKPLRDAVDHHVAYIQVREGCGVEQLIMPATSAEALEDRAAGEARIEVCGAEGSASKTAMHQAAHQDPLDVSSEKTPRHGLHMDSSAVAVCSLSGDAGAAVVKPRLRLLPLLYRLAHLKRVVYCPSGTSRSGRPADEPLLLRFVRICLEATAGRLVELQYDTRAVVSASSRSAQALRLPLAVVQSLVAMHPRSWILLDLPISMLPGAQAAPPEPPWLSAPESAPASSRAPSTQCLRTSGCPPPLIAPDPLTEGPPAPASPLQTFLAQGLPPALRALQLRLMSPHPVALCCSQGSSAFPASSPSTAPPPLTALTSLSLTNYSGCTPDHARRLVSGLPALRSLSLSWPIVTAARPVARRRAPVPVPQIQIQNQQDPGHVMAPEPPNWAGIEAASDGVPFSSPSQPLVSADPAASFWAELARLCSGLERLHVDMDADSWAQPGVQDIPYCFERLRSLHLGLHRNHHLPHSYLRKLLQMRRLSSLSLERVEFESQGSQQGGHGRGFPAPAAAASVSTGIWRCNSVLTSLCLDSLSHKSIAEILSAFGPDPDPALRHLHVARPEFSISSCLLDWVRLLRRMSHLGSLVLESTWQLDDAAIRELTGSPPEPRHARDTQSLSPQYQQAQMGDPKEQGLPRQHHLPHQHAESGWSGSGSGKCDAACGDDTAVNGPTGTSEAGGSVSAAWRTPLYPVASRLEHLGLLVSGCSASGASLAGLVRACPRLQTLHLGAIAEEKQMMAAVAVDCPNIRCLGVPEGLLERCRVALGGAQPILSPGAPNVGRGGDSIDTEGASRGPLVMRDLLLPMRELVCPGRGLPEFKI